MKKLGMLLREARKERGLKGYELAKKAGINPVYITQIEKHGKLPSASVMKMIANVLQNQSLFNLYIKIKFPELHEVVGEDLDFLEDECQELETMLGRKDLSPNERKDFLKRLENLLLKLQKSHTKLDKIMEASSKLAALLSPGKTD